MIDYELIKKARNSANSFRNKIGVRVVDIKEKEAICEMEVNKSNENQIHSIAGGCLYSLADSTAGTVCASYGIKATTVSSTFNYLSPGFNCTKLTAKAKEIKHGKKIAVINVDVFDQSDRLLCNGVFTFMFLNEVLDYLK